MAAENNQLKQFIQKSDIAALPVLHNTLQVLKETVEKPSFNYHYLDTILQYDPACMINLLAYANQEMTGDDDNQINQVEHAAMFLGMDRLEKFINKITSIYSIKDRAIANKIVQLQYRGVHAAFQAQNFARMLNVSNENEVYTSTLITPLSELLCWHLEPIKAQKVELLVHRKQQPYEQAQQEIFGFTYHELAESLTHHWKIPNLFLQRQEMEQLEDTAKPVKCMYLSEKCSIIAEKGWYFDDMYKHIRLCSQELHFSEARIAQELHKTAVELAHSTAEFFPVQNVSAHLALLPGEVSYTQVIEIDAPKKDTQKAPPAEQKPAFKPKAEDKPEKIPSIHLISASDDFPGLIRTTIDALAESRIFTRVVFMMLSKDKKNLQVRGIRGLKDPQFINTLLPIKPTNLFTKLLEKPQAVLINQANYDKFLPIITTPMQDMLKVKEFIARSVHANKKPIGLFYMDKFSGAEDRADKLIDVKDFAEVKKILNLFEKQLGILSKS